MQTLLNRRVLFLLCLMFALVLAATLNLRTSNARSGAVRHELSAGTSIAKTSNTLAPAKTAVGPRLQRGREISPFEWRSHSLMSPVGAALFAPVISAVKSAALGTDLNGNGFVNPGDTLVYSVVVGNTGGDAALNVVFTDTLNANLTLVPGSVKASPIGTNDTYGSIGNVGLNVPAAGGLLANDVSPTGNALSVSAVPSVSAQGGALSVSSNGAFTYNPPVGFSGIDSFSYTVNDGTQTDTGLVTINVSGVIWFVNNTPGACSSSCDGRLSNPFVNISNLNAVNDGLASHPKDNEHIFVYTGSGNYDGPLTLRNGQRLIGQGATASLAAITGISVPAFSNLLPATGGMRPTSLHTATHVTLNTNNLIRGINLQSTAGSTLLGTSFNGLNVSETVVNTTNSGGACNAAVSLNQGSGTAAINATFISVSANNCSNGIFLQNTTGSFTVDGDGTNTTRGGNGSGGTIANTSGADSTTNGIGVYLNNVQNVTLRRMQLNDHPNFALRGFLVNNFNLHYSTVNGSNGNNVALDEASVSFGMPPAPTGVNGLTGAATVTGCKISGGFEDNFQVINISGTLNRITFSDTEFGHNNTANGNNNLEVESYNAGTVLNVTVNGCDLLGARADQFVASNQQGSTMDVVFTNNALTNTHPGSAPGGARARFSANGPGSYNFSGNSVQGAKGSALFINAANSLANIAGRIENNTIGVQALANSGSSESSGITVQSAGGGDLVSLVNNNIVQQYNNHGILLQAGDSMGNPVVFQVAVTNNTVRNPGNINTDFNGVHLNNGTTAVDNFTSCIDIRTNTLAGSGSGTISPNNNDVRLRQRQATTVRLPGYGGANNNNTAVQTFVAGNQTTITTINAANTVPTAGGYIGGASCTAPSAAAPIEADGASPEGAQPRDSAAQAPAPGGGAPRFLARLGQWLNPAFAAFNSSLSYVSLDRAFDKAASALAPTVAAAELTATSQSATTNVPAQTLLINSKGEYRVVPTAAIPATFSGETITVNGTGSGFTLPAGESTTIMFNATIAAGFTGTSVPNQATVTAAGGISVNSNLLSTPVYQPPSISKGFGAASVPLNGTTTLTLTINNPNTATLTGVAVTDNFPAGLEVDGIPAATNTCGGTFTAAPGASSISLSGGMVGAGNSCAVSVQVKATTNGPKTNTTGNVTSLEGGTGNTATATLQVNNPPTITAIPQSVAAGSSAATFNIATVNDVEDGPTGVSFSISSNGVTFGSSATLNGMTVTYVANTAGTISATIATACVASTANFTIKATDTTSQSTTTTLTITVTANTMPTLSYGSPQTLTAGTSSTVNPATGPSDNGSVASIVVDSVTPGTGLTASVDNTTGVVSLNATVAGTYTVSIKATDNCGVMTITSFTVNVTCPTITVNPATLPNGAAGVSYSQNITAAPAGGSYTFAVTSGTLPAGLTLSSSGTLSGTPTTVGSSTFTVTATGFGSCTGSRSYTLTIDCPTITVNPATLSNGTAGTSYSANFTAAPAGGSYTFGVTSGTLPAGLTLASDGTLSGTPTTAGSSTFTVTATGFGSCTGSRSYTLTIDCPTITVNPATLSNGTAGTSYSANITASPASSYTFAVTSGTLPAGLTLASDGTLSGTPTTAGSSTFTVTATGFGTCTGSRSYTLTIDCPTITVNPATLPNGTAGTSYSQTVTASPAGGSYTFAATSGTVPPGLTLSSGGVLSGTPTTNGTFNFRITATGFGSCTGFRDYTVTIACPTITVNPATLPNGTAGTSYSQTVTASPAGGSYTFAATSGTVPPGLTLSSGGTLSGTPTTTGTFTFTVTATGFGSCTGSRSYTISIACPTITINTTSLPNTSRNANYNQTISVSPSGSYNFTVSSGALPPGLTLGASSGTISGTPTTNGSYTFTVTVTGAGGCTASRSYTISVNGNCPNVTQHDDLPNGTVGVTYFGSLSHVTPTNDYIITLQAGTLPPGLTISNVQEAIVGTPTAAGSYTFTLRATAPSGCYDDRIYTVIISGSAAVPGDFDGDRKADPAVFRNTQADWVISLSGSNALETPSWGAPGDLIASGDYDGDKRVDLAVFSPADGHWRIKRSSDGVMIDRAWGAATDVPVPGDYDGDGKTDLAVFRSAEGQWRIINSSDGAEQVAGWGLDEAGPDDVVPVPSDYDGDGKTDLAVFHRHNGTWSVRRSSDGAIVNAEWGLSTDTPVPGDYDGDGKTDLAVYRSQLGQWFVLRSSDKQQEVRVWGAAFALIKDVPVPGDYDGDGKTDLAIWRPALGMWYCHNSSDGVTHTLRLGQNGDTPVTAVRNR